MKLYYYKHCPFCTRVLMLLGAKSIEVEKVLLLNDDEKTPIDMIGAKQVPILEKDDGTYIAESLDIVKYLDELDGKTIFKQGANKNEELQKWFDDNGKTINKLLFPRFIRANLEELKTQSSIDYFVNKKEKTTGSIEENFNNTNNLLSKLNSKLIDLGKIFDLHYDNDYKYLISDDITVFPILRNITLIGGVEYPDVIKNYIKGICDITKLNVYYDIAI